MEAMVTTTNQRVIDDARSPSEELRESQQLVTSIESQLRASKAKLVKQLNEIVLLENERHCLNSSLSEVGTVQ